MKTEDFSKMKALSVKASMAGSMFMTAMMALTPVLASGFNAFGSTTENASINGTSIVQTMGAYVGTAFTYFGAIMILPTVILFVLALRSENPDSWVHVGQIFLVAVVSFVVGTLIKALIGSNGSTAGSAISGTILINPAIMNLLM